MDFFGPLMLAVTEGLRLVNTKESRKYLDEMLGLAQEYSDELLKPYQEQSDLTLIIIQRRVLVINEIYLRFKPATTAV